MKGTYDTILVGLDDSAHAQAVLAAAVKMAQATQAHLQVVSAIHFLAEATVANSVIGGGLLSPYVASGAFMDNEAMKQRQELTDRLEEQLAMEQLRSVEVVVELGEPKTIIMEQYTDFTGVLIVLGATSKKSLERLMLGSVAQYIVNHAPCDVLIVR